MERETLESVLLKLINNDRAAHNLKAYVWNQDLADIAAAHNALQYQHGTYSHQFPGEPNPRERIWTKLPGRYPGEICWWVGGPITTYDEARAAVVQIEQQIVAEGSSGDPHNPHHYDIQFSPTSAEPHAYTTVGISIQYGQKGLALTEDLIV